MFVALARQKKTKMKFLFGEYTYSTVIEVGCIGFSTVMVGKN